MNKPRILWTADQARLHFLGLGKKSVLHFVLLRPCRFPSNDANPAHSPLAEFCVPCVPSGTGENHPQPAAPQNYPSPLVRPQEAPCARFPPQVGKRPVPARLGGGLGHTGPSLAERKENSPARKAAASANEEYASVRLPIRHTGSPKTSSGERCEKQAGERPGVAHRRPVPGHFARQSRSFWDFSQASISPPSGVGFGALGSRTGSEKQNFPSASHFCGCHRRGQRKDEEKYVR